MEEPRRGPQSAAREINLSLLTWCSCQPFRARPLNTSPPAHSPLPKPLLYSLWFDVNPVEIKTLYSLDASVHFFWSFPHCRNGCQQCRDFTLGAMCMCASVYGVEMSWALSWKSDNLTRCPNVFFCMCFLKHNRWVAIAQHQVHLIPSSMSWKVISPLRVCCSGQSVCSFLSRENLVCPLLEKRRPLRFLYKASLCER